MNVYSKYFQKSKVFLYPLLNIPNSDENNPYMTYIASGTIKPEDYKIICLYRKTNNKDFRTYLNEVLKKNKHFENHVDLYTKQIVIFNLQDYKEDFNLFINGKYSQLSLSAKSQIVKFYVVDKKRINYIESFLEPQHVHSDYAAYLDLPLHTIVETYEVCQKPNMIKEECNYNLSLN